MADAPWTEAGRELQQPHPPTAPSPATCRDKPSSEKVENLLILGNFNFSKERAGLLPSHTLRISVLLSLKHLLALQSASLQGRKEGRKKSEK